jgi:hypothetical protein
MADIVFHVTDGLDRLRIGWRAFGAPSSLEDF